MGDLMEYSRELEGKSRPSTCGSFVHDKSNISNQQKKKMDYSINSVGTTVQPFGKK